MRSFRLRLLTACSFFVVALLLACGAPASRPAKGPIGQQLEAARSSGRATFDHREWNDLLAAGVRDGRVDYAYFKRERKTLDGYLERLGSVDLGSLAPEHLKALLINAYNALTIRSILDAPGVGSIRDIDGVWKKAVHRVGGFDLTLDAIEHNLLRPYFKDPRIHFVVNCASRSCAPLPSWAFTGERLEEQIEERTRAFLQDESQVRIEDGVLRVSSYFDWYGSDFSAEGWAPRADSYVAFIGRYARDDVKGLIAAAGGSPGIAFLEYDWSLNSQ